MQHDALKNNSASIDHLGIAVKSLQAAKSFYSILGLEISDEEIVEQEQVKLVMVKLGDSRLELLEPLSEESPVGRFLVRRGEGLHHVGYRVHDCAAALAAVVAAGGRPIDAAPRPGSRGTTVAFVHPKGSFGTLIELVQE